MKVTLIFCFLSCSTASKNLKYPGSPTGERGRDGFYSSQYHYSSSGSSGSNGNTASKRPGTGSFVNSVTADPVYAQYLAVSFVVLMIAIGFLLYPIFSEGLGSRSYRNFNFNILDTINTLKAGEILESIEKIHETYSRSY